jgi:hypothetical protein
VLFAGWRTQKAPHVPRHYGNSQRPNLEISLRGGFRDIFSTEQELFQRVVMPHIFANLLRLAKLIASLRLRKFNFSKIL